MERSSLKYLTCIPLIMLAMVIDWGANSFKTTDLYPSLAAGILMLTFLFAFGGPIMEYFADGDMIVTTIAFLVALTSFAMSVLSGISQSSQSAVDHNLLYTQRQSWQHELDTELTVAAIDKCAGSSTCISQDKRDRKAHIRSELEKGKYPNSPAQSDSSVLLDWVMIIMLGMVPVANFGLARIISKARPPKSPKKHIRTETQATSADSGTKSGNIGPITKDERGLQDGTKPVVQDEQEKPKTKSRTQRATGSSKNSSVPSEKQADKLAVAYMTFPPDVDVKRDALARKAGVGNGPTGWWLNNSIKPARGVVHLPVPRKKDN